MKGYFILYSSNILVDGKCRSAIYNLSCREIYIIPSSFSRIIRDFENSPIEKVRKAYAHQLYIFDSYMNFLTENDLGFITRSPRIFSKMNLEYHSPEVINTAVIDYSDGYSFELLITQLNECNCKNLLIYIKHPLISLSYIERLLKTSTRSTLRTITLFFDYFSAMHREGFEELFETYKKLYNVIVCSAPESKIINVYKNKIIYLTAPMDEIREYELKDYLIINYTCFFESHHFNPYYNRKVFIDAGGGIKNSMYKETVFGYISHDKLYDIMSGKQFQKLWKEMPVELAKSEFRYCLYNPSTKPDESKFKNCKIVEMK